MLRRMWTGKVWTRLALVACISASFAGSAGCAAAPSRAATSPADARDATSDAKSDAPKKAEEAAPIEVEPVPVPIEGSDLVEARATTVVNAPLDVARATVLKFEDYPQFMPEYSDTKRLGKLPSGNEQVYMEITTLGGIAKMYADVEILAPQKNGAVEIHEGRFIKGNVRNFKAIWTLTPQGENKTEVTLQVFLHPALPLPDFLVNTANLDGAKKGVIAMRKRIEAANTK